jgi:hypothetical protein
LRSPSGSGEGVLSRNLGRGPPMQNLACLLIHKKEKWIMFSRCEVFASNIFVPLNDDITCEGGAGPRDGLPRTKLPQSAPVCSRRSRVRVNVGLGCTCAFNT